MIALILIAALIAAFAYFDPYVDINEDSVLLWYNTKDCRNYIILWSRKN